MYVTITNNTHEILYRITINNKGDGLISYDIVDFVENNVHTGELYNFEGGALEILEKVLHGRKLS